MESSNNTVVTNKAGRIIKPPRPVNAALKAFDTAHYQLYNPWDPSRKHVGRKVPDNHRFTKFDPFDHYLLYMNPGNPTIEEIPFPGIRLDDRTVAIVLDGLRGRSSKSLDARCLLHARWPAEFDEQHMIRATRIPLGHAAKKLVQVGDIDLNGNFVQEGQQGYYYLWWGKIHCLMGKEGYDAGRYLIRPSHEDLHPNIARPSLGFKLGYRAEVQFPSGDPMDPTFR